jgi:O-antigen/teichoic acid export membrane protein
LLRGEIASFLRIDDHVAILLCLAIISIGVITPSFRGILQGEQDFVRFSISLLLEVFLKVAFGVALVYAGMSVPGAMFGWMGGAAVALVYTLWAVFSRHGARAEAPVRLGIDVRRLAQTTICVGLATGLVTFVSFMDVLLVKHYFPAHEAGLYAAVNLTGKIVLFLVGFVPAVLLPKAVAKHANGDNPIPLLLQAATITVVMCGGTLLAFGVFPVEAVRAIAGADFIGAAPYVFQYDAAMALLAIITLLVNYRIGVHRFGFLYGLSAVFLADIIAIGLAHRTLWDIVHILLAGNAVGVAVCCYGIAARAPRSAPLAEEAA